MRARLAYGSGRLEVDLPDAADITVVEPAFVPGVPDPVAAISAAPRAPIGSPPLGALVKPGPVAVVTTNSGCTLDLNLYQAVKGMSAAARIVRAGGAIVIAAECRDGVPAHGSFGRLLREAHDHAGLLARLRAPGVRMGNRWQAHTLALILAKAEVHVHADGLSDDEVTAALCTPCPSVGRRVAELLERFGRGARVCVLPEGPQTIPHVADASRKGP